MNAPNPGAVPRMPTLPRGPFGSKPPPCWLTVKSGLLARGPDRVELGVEEVPAVAGEPGEPDPAEALLLRPVDLLDRLIDIVERARQLTPPPLGRLRAEVDEPAVVRLPADFAELDVGGSGEVVEAIHLERLAVREEHLGDDADALEHLGSEIGVPLHLGVELGMQVAGVAHPRLLGLLHLLVVDVEVLLRDVLAVRAA